MSDLSLLSVCEKFLLPSKATAVSPLGNGLINHTYLAECADGSRFVLQKINTVVFSRPKEMMENIIGVCAFLANKIQQAGGDPTREAMRFVPTPEGTYYYQTPDGEFYRMSYFIDRAVAYDSPERPGILYEAAYAFGRFQRLLSDYPADTLYETIPNFHNTPVRYQNFEDACAKDVAGRAASVTAELDALRRYAPYVSSITEPLEKHRIPLRVTHNDTKLNNVLIDPETNRAICVLDLDTVMPGSLLYDFGDSLRFAGNHGAEDDRDLSRVWLDLSRYEEYVSGFLKGVGDGITKEEKELLPISVFMLTYENALRFMTDYLNGDVYFKILTPDHNLARTRAHLRLMEDILSKLDDMRAIGEKY